MDSDFRFQISDFNKNLIATLIVLFLCIGCAPSPRYTVIRTGGKSTAPFLTGDVPVAKPPVGTKFRGTASFYADKYHGKKTSNGEVFDMNGLTCAMNILPFDTWLEVKNLSNERKVIVRVNDRGPFVEGRIIDLSLGAARELGMVGAGIQEVEITVIK
jgi:rare lipoprotein A